MDTGHAGAVNAVDALFFGCGIPPARQVNDMGGGGEDEPDSGGFLAEDQHLVPVIRKQVPLKATHNYLPVRGRGIAIDRVDPLEPEHLVDDVRKTEVHAAILDEGEEARAGSVDLLRDLDDGLAPFALRADAGSDVSSAGRGRPRP